MLEGQRLRRNFSDIGWDGFTISQRAGKMPRSVPYDDYLIESLKNQRRAKAYLNAALEDGDPRVFLLALRNVAKARGVEIASSPSAQHD